MSITALADQLCGTTTPNDPAGAPQKNAAMLHDDIYAIRTRSPGPAGALPLTDEMLRTSPSGDIFGLTQNAGMGWDPRVHLRR